MISISIFWLGPYILLWLADFSPTVRWEWGWGSKWCLRSRWGLFQKIASLVTTVWDHKILIDTNGFFYFTLAATVRPFGPSFVVIWREKCLTERKKLAEKILAEKNSGKKNLVEIFFPTVGRWQLLGGLWQLEGGSQ